MFWWAIKPKYIFLSFCPLPQKAHNQTNNYSVKVIGEGFNGFYWFNMGGHVTRCLLELKHFIFRFFFSLCFLCIFSKLALLQKSFEEQRLEKQIRVCVCTRASLHLCVSDPALTTFPCSPPRPTVRFPIGSACNQATVAGSLHADGFCGNRGGSVVFLDKGYFH